MSKTQRSKVCIIGAEGWGSAIATAVCPNALTGNFDSRVHIYVYDELVRNNYLSEVMNERHENIKYLPGIKLPENLIAVNDLHEAATNADILIFATPLSFVKCYCNMLAGKLKSTAYAVSLIKGLEHIDDGDINLSSSIISNQLQIPCYSLMCANSAMEMAQGKLCEITVGCDNRGHSEQLASMLQTENCKVVSVRDIDSVELCNTLKDVIALSAGFIDGLRLGDNARIACLHLGLKEMMRFIKAFNPTTQLSTFFESSVVANSVASAYADKNATFAKNFVTGNKTIPEIEANLLNGRKLLGPIVAMEVSSFLRKEQLEDQFPLFTTVNRICQSELPPEALLDTLRNHPDLRNESISELMNEEHLLEALATKFTNAIPESDIVDLEGDQLIADEMAVKALNSVTEGKEDWPAYHQYFEAVEEAKNDQIEHTLEEPKPDDHDLRLVIEMNSKDGQNISVELKDKPKLDKYENAYATATASLGETDQLMGSNDNNLDTSKGNVISDDNMVYMSTSGKSDKTKQSRIRKGLSQLIERHVRPFNDKYKALKVRAKSSTDAKSNEKKDDSKTPKSSQAEKSPFKQTEVEASSINEIPNPMVLASDESKDVKAEQLNKPNKKSDKQVVYEKNSMFGRMLAEEEPYMSSVTETIHNMQDEALSRELVEESHNKVPKETDQINSTKAASVENILASSQISDQDHDKTDKNLLSSHDEDNSHMARSPHRTPSTYVDFKHLENEADNEDQHAKSAAEALVYDPESNEFYNLLETEQPKLTPPMYELDQPEAAVHSEDALGETLAIEAKAFEGRGDDLSKILQDEVNRELSVENPEHVAAVPLHIIDEKIQVKAMGSKNTSHTHEDPNLRFYHGRNDGEQGPEWDWLRASEIADNVPQGTYTEHLKYIMAKDNSQQSGGNKKDGQQQSKPTQDKPRTLKDAPRTQQPSTPPPFEQPRPIAKQPLADDSKKLNQANHTKQTKQRSKSPAESQARQAAAEKKALAIAEKFAEADAADKYIAEEIAKLEAKAKRTAAEALNINAKPKETETAVKVKARRASKEKEEVPAAETAKKDAHVEKPFKAAEIKSDQPLPKKQKPYKAPEIKSEQPKYRRAEEEAPETKTKLKARDKPKPKTPIGDVWLHEQYEQKPPKKEKRQTSKIRKILSKGLGQHDREQQEQPRERAVDYDGEHPYKKEPKLPSETQALTDHHEQKEGLQRNKVVVNPPFHPPLNPRVRTPRPPFDVRDHEYHTLSYRAPPDLLRNVKLPLRRSVAAAPNKPVATLSFSKLSRPSLKMPTCTMRSSILAVELGIFATLLARYKPNRK
ncbi:Gpdh [Drosophila busckii]|uniref:Glycerol-3-phosphate dehydrogenase [NAD(+)] n=1 Tax=Drosophila busckii TaxID=30019 RepID=A0A0M5J0F2_DROBS|nr:uncharacterized protein LOC108603908 [Drosophila busckii]ALC47581.1 Gpdh [Drosophila busckii]